MWRWLFFLPALLGATQTKPWYPDMLQLWTYSRYSYEDYKGGYLHRAQGGLLLSPWPTISSELELGLAGGTSSGFFFDFGKLTLRYLLLDDILGDPVSLSIGTSATFSSLTSRRNLATPHLGSVDWALHAALGKEWSCERWWTWRLWSVGEFAIANQGAPGLWGSINLARNFCDSWELGGWLFGLLDLGKRQLHEVPNFRGYGPIQARAIELGLWSTLRLDVYGHLRLDYRYRAYARNYPKRDHLIGLTYWFPISI